MAKAKEDRCIHIYDEQLIWQIDTFCEWSGLMKKELGDMMARRFFEEVSKDLKAKYGGVVNDTDEG